MRGAGPVVYRSRAIKRWALQADNSSASQRLDCERTTHRDRARWCCLKNERIHTPGIPSICRMRRLRGLRNAVAAMRQQRFLITATDRQRLTAWIRAGTTPQRIARRAHIVLLAAEGSSARTIAQRLGISAHSVALWRRRFQASGPDALMRDAPGRGRKATVTVNADARMRTLLEMPPPARRWTVRALAAAMGISRASMHRVLKTRKVTLTSDGGSEDTFNASTS